MFGLYDKMFPPDDPKARHRWRATIGNSVFVLLAFAIFISSAMFFNIPKVGSLVWAADVDRKVSEAVKPLEERMTKVEDAVKQTTSTTKMLLAKLASDQIDTLVRRRCKSSDADEIQYLSREIRKYQEEYEASRGRPYPTPTCEEVGFKEKVR